MAAASTGLGQPMVSLETSKLEAEQLLVAARLVARGRSTAARRSSACSPCRATSRPTRRSCARLGADAREVRVPADLDGLDALVIPAASRR